MPKWETFDLAGKVVRELFEEDVYFTDDTLLRVFCDRDAGTLSFELWTVGYKQMVEAANFLEDSIMRRGWAYHNATYVPERGGCTGPDSRNDGSHPRADRISLGWGGFYRLPEAERWHDMRRQVLWAEERRAARGWVDQTPCDPCWDELDEGVI